MPRPAKSLIARLRSSSRQLVRELGFLNRTLAGSGLPPSSVHALIEIARASDITARDLSDILLLEKSTVSRMLLSLIRKGLIEEQPSARDSRVKYLHLTQQGHVRHRVIAQSAEDQIIRALTPLPPPEQRKIVDGMESYTGALTACRRPQPARPQSGSGAEPSPTSAAPSPRLLSGYTPGLLARITLMHADYYAGKAGFGADFEAVVAAGLADFAPRIARPRNLLLRAEQDGRIRGSIAIDGEDLGGDLAHLRWFIVDEALRGSGAGRALLRRALEFCDRRGFAETHLWTFQGLEAARRLYESHGFRLTESHRGRQWGSEVLEQKYVRPLGGRDG